jgi:uncharacterized protein YbjT (DUF2867 family)
MGKSALVLGATGLIGGHLLEQLLASDTYDKVTVVGRSSTGQTHAKLIEHIFELSEDQLDQHAGLLQGDVLFICLGTTIKKAGSKEAFRQVDYDIPLKAARIARDNGAGSIMLVSSSGADADSRFFYLQVKGSIELAIQAIGFERSLIFRPAGLLGKRVEFRPGEILGVGAMKLASPLMVGPLRKNRPIRAEYVAFVMAHLPLAGIDGVRTYESDQIQALYDQLQ